MNDPTRSGSPLAVDPGKTLDLSRNELESLCTKASRGAGMSWGLAEEAGYAAGWLMSRGLDGAALLSRQLRSAQGKSWQEICPVVLPGTWCATIAGQPLCPIALGATLSDHLSVDAGLFDGPGLRVGAVTSPGLILPYVAMAAAARGKAMHIRSENDVVRIDVDGTLSGSVPMLLAVDCGVLVICVEDDTAAPDCVPDVEIPETASAATAVPVTSEVLRFLQELSMRTTVPASAASRNSAGAVGSDND